LAFLAALISPLATASAISFFAIDLTALIFSDFTAEASSSSSNSLSYSLLFSFFL
jgi:hypothetical protein